MPESRPSFLLVDGNNIVHAWPDLLALHRRRKESARDELIRRLEAYRDFSGERIVVVFDGRGDVSREERRESGLQVFFSGSGQTADDLIERLSVRYADRFDLCVATDDRSEQDMVSAAGAEVLSSSGLRDRLEASERGMQDWIDRHRRRP